MAEALYRKYRSKSLSEVVGQSHVTDVLTRSLQQGRIAHAYLLTGPRGIGKTSIARILAYEINQLPYDEQGGHLDIIEIDAASNNGVEDVRDLREKVQIAPVSARKKIYIIDEVHMLSKAAFNALLKTLEEPPEHAVFILATTDADKLPPTIISRTQRFSLRSILPADATHHLKHIAKQEGIKISDDAVELIALRGDGSFRDSISLLDQLSSLSDEKGGITRELVERALGLAPLDHVEKLLSAYIAKDLQKIVELLDESELSGVQPSVIVGQLVATIRTQLIDKPQLLQLLDQLIEVPKSAHPNIKLLTVLGAHAARPKSVALVAPIAEISVPLRELEKQAVIARPVNPPSAKITPQKPASSRQSTPSQKTSTPQPVHTGKLGVVDWEKVVEYARQNFVAIYGVLSKCSPQVTGDTLVLYTGNSFYKKKLDDTKYNAHLFKALSETGAAGYTIETIGTPPPPKDSTAAAVAAIMGGGEEVTVAE